MNNVLIYDLEVTKEDWLAVFRRPDSTGYTVIHNDTARLRSFIGSQSDLILGGFNNKFYDDYILLAMLEGADNLEVKHFNDYIIEKRGEPWSYDFIRGKRKPFKSFDLRDDIPKDLSLKAIEGNMKKPIVESSIPFDIDRALRPDELEEMIRYCKYDVDSTVDLYHVRKPDYLDAKKLIAEMYNLPVADALGMTNAKLCARILDAKYTPRNDERDYVVPNNIDLNLIPKSVYDFFMQIQDKSIPNEVLFGEKGREGLTYSAWIETKVGRCPVKWAWGGIHGAKPCVIVENTADRVILNYDVSSLYPNSMLNFGYCSRSMGSADAYRKLVERRLCFKHSGDKLRSDALKLPINTTYGAMLNQYNDLCDRWAGRSVCISNQLAMTMLIVSLSQSCESIDFININTDGIMFSIDRNEVEAAERLIAEWSDITKFEMERDDFIKVIQKDVNNYIGIMAEVDEKTGKNKFKTKGGFVSLYKGGTFKSNSMSIVDKAVVDYLVNGIAVEDTIRNCKDIFAFQTIAKMGSSYSGAFHIVNSEKIPVQKVNRIYAVKNPIYGQIKKGKWITEKRKKNKSTGKMESAPVDPPVWSESAFPDFPEHTFIDNQNTLTTADIDLDYYIDKAKKRIQKYTEVDPKVQRQLEKIKEVIRLMPRTKAETPTTETPNTEDLNVWEKLNLAREMFAAKGITKNGINRYAKFKYYTLDDIVPAKLEIFKAVGLVDNITFTQDAALLTLFNVNNPSESILFSSPLAADESMISNPIQKLGAVQTYLRRYLYLLMLDIVEPETVDAISGQDEPKTKAAKPATAAERKETAKAITNADGQATDEEKKAVKRGLKKLRESKDDHEPYIREVLTKLKGDISKTECEELLIEIGEKLA